MRHIKWLGMHTGINIFKMLLCIKITMEKRFKILRVTISILWSTKKLLNCIQISIYTINKNSKIHIQSYVMD